MTMQPHAKGRTRITGRPHIVHERPKEAEILFLQRLVLIGLFPNKISTFIIYDTFKSNLLRVCLGLLPVKATGRIRTSSTLQDLQENEKHLKSTEAGFTVSTLYLSFNEQRVSCSERKP